MKLTVWMMVCLLIMVSVPVFALNLTDKMVAYYSLDSLNISDDYTGTYPAWYVGTQVQQWNNTDCVKGNCVGNTLPFSSFPDDRIWVNKISLSKWSVGFWEYVTGNSAGGSDSGRILPIGCMGGNSDCGLQNRFNLWEKNYSGTYSRGVYFDATITNTSITVPDNYTYHFNVWEYRLTTYDGENLSFYHNDILIARVKPSSTVGINFFTLLDAYSSDYDFLGRIDEIVVYNRSLDDAGCLVNQSCGGEVAVLFNGGDGFLPLNETSEPQASNPQSNASSYTEGQDALFSSYWESNTTLQTYIFSWNATGEWTNDTAVVIDAKSAWVNVTKTINSSMTGKNISWTVYVDDLLVTKYLEVQTFFTSALCNPIWECIDYLCLGGINYCTTVNDTEGCGGNYTGNYTEFQGRCAEKTGYKGNYSAGDLAPITGDVIGEALYQTKVNVPLMILSLMILLLILLIIAIRKKF